MFFILEKIKLSKELAASGIRSNFPDGDQIETVDDLNHGLFYPSSQMTGVLVFIKCNHSEKILRIVSILTFDLKYFEALRLT